MGEFHHVVQGRIRDALAVELLDPPGPPLVHFPDELGPGLAIFLPKGAIVRKLMEDWSREEHLRRGYDLVYTPHIGKANLWQTSGHLGFYRENMYDAMEVDGQEYFAKPMNCPFHIMMVKSRARSYRDFPLRLSDFGHLHRNELSGTLSGLTRIRGFRQDDAHVGRWICIESHVRLNQPGSADGVFRVWVDGEPLDLVLFVPRGSSGLGCAGVRASRATST